MNHLEHKRTGRSRFRVLKRWFKPDLLVLQVEMEGFIPEYSQPSIEGGIRTYWVDAKPEWLMEQVKEKI